MNLTLTPTISPMRAAERLSNATSRCLVAPPLPCCSASRSNPLKKPFDSGRITSQYAKYYRTDNQADYVDLIMYQNPLET